MERGTPSELSVDPSNVLCEEAVGVAGAVNDSMDWPEFFTGEAFKNLKTEEPCLSIMPFKQKQENTAIAEFATIKKERRLFKNRKSAERSRQRKKAMFDDAVARLVELTQTSRHLQSKIHELEHKNRALVRENNALKAYSGDRAAPAPVKPASVVIDMTDLLQRPQPRKPKVNGGSTGRSIGKVLVLAIVTFSLGFYTTTGPASFPHAGIAHTNGFVVSAGARSLLSLKEVVLDTVVATTRDTRRGAPPAARRPATGVGPPLEAAPPPQAAPPAAVAAAATPDAAPSILLQTHDGGVEAMKHASAAGWLAAVQDSEDGVEAIKHASAAGWLASPLEAEAAAAPPALVLAGRLRGGEMLTGVTL